MGKWTLWSFFKIFSVIMQKYVGFLREQINVLFQMIKSNADVTFSLRQTLLLYVWYYLPYYHCSYLEICDAIIENNTYSAYSSWKIVMGIGEGCWIYFVLLAHRDEV